MKKLSKLILFIALLCIPAFAQEPSSAPRTVYIVLSGNGTRYHLEDCRTIRNSEKEEVVITEAKQMGYTPCGVCKPGT